MVSIRVVLVTVMVLSTSCASVVVGTNLVGIDDDDVPAAVEFQDGTDPLTGDTDGDGLDDGEEKNAGTDPNRADSDDDGLSDAAEVDEHGTDPLAADTDGDSLDDDQEVGELGTDPLERDSDGDGLDDAEEVDIGTRPTIADTDTDGLNDGRETGAIGTDPVAPDTDDDGLTDGEEVDRYSTDPLAVDTDADGLTDGPEVNEHGTNPTRADTDGDGLTDGEEVNDLWTDPVAADTDGDDLEDGREVSIGTAPRDSDTDGDGLPDGAEVTNADRFPGADPLRMDIYVEVDEMRGTGLSRTAASQIAEAYDDAPVSNPDGTTGVTLHFEFSDDVPSQSTIDYSLRSDSDYGEYESEYFDNEGYGYHYLLVVEDADCECGGFAYRGNMVVVESWSSRYTGLAAMHELGHSVGLSSDVFNGIDSRRYSGSEYPSVMNYNTAYEQYRYSSGGSSENDFDDWGYIGEHLYTPSTDEVGESNE